jgi:hypothetical protein
MTQEESQPINPGNSLQGSIVFDAPKANYNFVVLANQGSGGLIVTNTGQLFQCSLGLI